MEFLKESWEPESIALFEYHCLESAESSDVELWLRSHQTVKVLQEEDSDAWEGSTLEERAECGQLRCYRVRFADGFEGTAMEDELMTDSGGFYRPDPPTRGECQP